MNITVSDHALERCIERLGCSKAEARALLTSPAVQAAADFGARIIRCARGRIVLTFTPIGVTVLTVLPISDHFPHQLMPAVRGGAIPVSRDPHFHPREDRNHAA